jgi:hypothetical protein
VLLPPRFNIPFKWSVRLFLLRASAFIFR